MKKVLWVVDEQKFGGVSNVLKKIISSFPKKQFTVLVLHNNGHALENLPNVNLIFGSDFFEVADLSIKEIRSIRLFIKKVYLVFLLKTGLIKNKIKKERKRMKLSKYDIEISFKDGLGTYFVAYGDAVKKVRWLHADYSNNDPGKKYKKTYPDAINEYHQIIAISQGVAKNFNNKYHQEKITDIIYNIIDTNLPKRQEINDGKLRLIAVGRLNYIKGYSRLLKVMDRLNNDHLLKNVNLRIVGDGEELKNLESLICQYHLENNVELLGYSNNPWHLVNDGDLFILSSYSEACALTVIESQLVNIPVLAMEYASSKESIDPNMGIIIDNNEDALYQELKKIILNPKILKELQKNVVHYHYDNDKSIKKIERLLGLYEKNIK